MKISMKGGTGRDLIHSLWRPACNKQARKEEGQQRRRERVASFVPRGSIDGITQAPTPQ